MKQNLDRALREDLSSMRRLTARQEKPSVAGEQSRGATTVPYLGVSTDPRDLHSCALRDDE